MEIKAKAKHIRISPKKVRLVVDVIRGLSVAKALSQLDFINKQATRTIKKLVDSAIANAEHDYEISKDNLYIKEIRVDEGRTLKRWQPRAHGRATPIRKRTSHIILVLGELKESGTKKAKKQEIEAPINLEAMAKKQDKKDAKAESPVQIAEQSSKGELPQGEKKGFASKMFRRKSG